MPYLLDIELWTDWSFSQCTQWSSAFDWFSHQLKSVSLKVIYSVWQANYNTYTRDVLYTVSVCEQSCESVHEASVLISANIKLTGYFKTVTEF